MKKNWHNKYIQKALAPDNSLKTQKRALFLAACESKFGKPVTSQSMAWVFALRTVGSAVTAILILTTASAYADGTNVGISNTLYPLKRAYEKVRITVADQSEKHELQIEYTSRRLEELKQSESLPDTHQSSELLRDAKKNAEQVLIKLKEIKNETGNTNPVNTGSLEQRTMKINPAIPAPINYENGENPELQSQPVTSEVPETAALRSTSPTPNQDELMFKAEITESQTSTKPASENKKEDKSERANPETDTASPKKQADTAKTVKSESKDNQTRKKQTCAKVLPVIEKAKTIQRLDDETARILDELDETCSEN